MSRKLVLIMTLMVVLIGMLGVAIKVQRVEASGTIILIVLTVAIAIYKRKPLKTPIH